MRLLLVVAGLGLGLFACGKPPCSASTCATGCCDAAGDCQPGTQAFACGLAGATCNACLLGQQCVQGACFGGTGAGGGGGGTGGSGGSSCSPSNCAGCCDSTGFCQTGTQNNTCGAGGASCTNCANNFLVCSAGGCVSGSGGGSGGGAGGGTGGGAGGGTGGGTGIRLMPQTATVSQYGGLELSAEITGNAPNQLIDWSIESGGGEIYSTGPSSAQFYPYSANATVRIRAQANFLSSLASYADLTIDQFEEPFLVVPQEFSASAFVLAIGQPQTFTAVRQSISPSGFLEGLRGVDWFVWPAGTIAADGTLIPQASMQRIYAREQSTNMWASSTISPQTTTLPSVAITPARVSTTTNGVVQFTANLSSGSPQWLVASPNGGSISSTGTYTAPPVPGIYVIVVEVVGASRNRAAAATIIVQ